MNKPLQILIAEDHLTVRAGLKLIVNREADMEVIAEASDGREAIKYVQQLEPDMLLLDVSMPEVNGLVAAANLKRICPDVKILILTRHTEEAYLQELLEAGVDGYVLKQSATSELVRAIRQIAEGKSYLDPHMTKNVVFGFGSKKNKLRGDLQGSLTEREAEILRFIALGYSNKEISEKLEISIKTVEAHKSNSLKKLNLETRKDIVKYAIFQGWLVED
jgi:DNA-binding NarL/FixJ family response regulator